MQYAVLLRIDAAGRRPVIVGPDTDLRGDAEVRWRFVAETDDEGEAYRILGMLHGKILNGEV